MSVKRQCPCDIDGICPYEAEYWRDCEYWCGADEPEDYPPEYEFDDDPHEVVFCDEPDRDSYGEFSYFMETEADYYGE